MFKVTCCFSLHEARQSFLKSYISVERSSKTQKISFRSFKDRGL